ncbi:response regulator transcription factor [bacterium]|jgi:two-component system, OmpR family, alkaline phosphatase synthesis response regulator PhoP|nr:response regulator transcription factor [bacterium]
MKKILIVEDEEDIIELIRYNLVKEGYDVDSLTNGAIVYDHVKRTSPELILLDLMLPGLDGLDVCKQLKMDTETAHIPIVMVSAKSDESDIVSGLELGADDYVTKPFSVKVLIARIRGVLRRKQLAPQSKETPLVIHQLKISPEKRVVHLNNTEIDLTFSEFETLFLLASQPGRVLTRYQIVGAVHGHDYAVTDRSIDVLMVALRKKLGDKADYIQTIRGVGYRFKETVDGT